MNMSDQCLRRFSPAAQYIARVLILLLCAAPGLWLLFAALQPMDQPLPAQLRAPAVSLEAIAHVLARTTLPLQMLRSAVLAAAAAMAALCIGAGAGYALSGLPARVQRRAAAVLLLAAAAPASGLWLGRFMLMRALGMMDTPLALLLPPLTTGSLLGALLLWRAFSRVGSECIDAARLDAGGHLPVLWLMLGAARPTAGLSMALTFAQVWGDALSPVLFAASPALATWPVGLSALAQLERTQWALLMAGALLVTIPALAASGWIPFLQHAQLSSPEGVPRHANEQQLTGS